MKKTEETLTKAFQINGTEKMIIGYADLHFYVRSYKKSIIVYSFNEMSECFNFTEKELCDIADKLINS